MKYSHNKDINSMVKELLKHGWVVIRKNKHVKLQSPTGKTTAVPSTPSDVRAILNFRADIKRMELASTGERHD
jgi:predicted RNA binding protein YcfA (HicA-like mRNA interferase family)